MPLVDPNFAIYVYICYKIPNPGNSFMDITFSPADCYCAQKLICGYSMVVIWEYQVLYIWFSMQYLRIWYTFSIVDKCRCKFSFASVLAKSKICPGKKFRILVLT